MFPENLEDLKLDLKEIASCAVNFLHYSILNFPQIPSLFLVLFFLFSSLLSLFFYTAL